MSSGQEPKPEIPHPLRVCGETQVKMEPEKKVSVLISPPSRLEDGSSRGRGRDDLKG